MTDDLTKRLDETAMAIEWGNPVRVSVVELLREAAKALGIVRRLAALDESQVSSEDGYGSTSCMFCGADRTCDEAHAPDCLWIEVRRLFEQK